MRRGSARDKSFARGQGGAAVSETKQRSFIVRFWLIWLAIIVAVLIGAVLLMLAR